MTTRNDEATKTDDSDLADLLGDDNDQANVSTATTNKEQEDVNELQQQSGAGGGGDQSRPDTATAAPLMKHDHMDTDGTKVHQISPGSTGTGDYRRPSRGRHRHLYSSENPGVCDYFFAFISLVCHYHPCFCGILVFGTIFFGLLTLGNLIFNPVREFGVIHEDLTNIRSKMDLTMGRLDHWCLEGEKADCLCEDPLTPSPKLERKAWVQAFNLNKRKVRSYRDELKAIELDVAFLGDSVVEEMTIQRYFVNKFKKEFGAKIEAVALGIAGDTSPNVLYRILNGEMPEYFTPKVWWLSLGMNDLAKGLCSEDVVFLGILRVVEEILENNPHARVVINSLFPMVSLRGEVLMNDYKDAFRSQTSHRVPDFSKEGNRRLGLRRLDAQPTSGGQKPHNTGGRPLATKSRGDIKAVIEREEELRQNNAHVPHDHEKVNPIMDANKHNVRKYQPLAGFMKKRSIPLWTSINAINTALRKFADEHERVHFFDATPLFTRKTGTGKYMLLSEYITSKGNPTPAGYGRWLAQVSKKLEYILEDLQHHHPELFVSNEVDTKDFVDNLLAGDIDMGNWEVVEGYDDGDNDDDVNGSDDGDNDDDVNGDDDDDVSEEDSADNSEEEGSDEKLQGDDNNSSNGQNNAILENGMEENEKDDDGGEDDIEAGEAEAAGNGEEVNANREEVEEVNANGSGKNENDASNNNEQQKEAVEVAENRVGGGGADGGSGEQQVGGKEKEDDKEEEQANKNAVEVDDDKAVSEGKEEVAAAGTSTGKGVDKKSGGE